MTIADHSCSECGAGTAEESTLTYDPITAQMLPICATCVAAGLVTTQPTHAVYYHSVGCLPDHDSGPGWEFAGSELECDQWLADNLPNYDTSSLYVLYYEPIEWENES